MESRGLLQAINPAGTTPTEPYAASFCCKNHIARSHPHSLVTCCCSMSMHKWDGRSTTLSVIQQLHSPICHYYRIRLARLLACLCTWLRACPAPALASCSPDAICPRHITPRQKTTRGRACEGLLQRAMQVVAAQRREGQGSQSAAQAAVYGLLAVGLM